MLRPFEPSQCYQMTRSLNIMVSLPPTVRLFSFFTTFQAWLFLYSQSSLWKKHKSISNGIAVFVPGLTRPPLNRSQPDSPPTIEEEMN